MCTACYAVHAVFVSNECNILPSCEMFNFLIVCDVSFAVKRFGKIQTNKCAKYDCNIVYGAVLNV